MSPTPADFERLRVEIYDGEDRALRTRRKVLEDFGIMEREYMRRFLLHYRLIAQLTPPCFEWARDPVASARKNTKAWRN